MQQQNNKQGMKPRRGGNDRGGAGRPPKEVKEFDQIVVDLSRVTRVTKGGKQMSFRATVVVGDRKGRVGYGIAKGKDVQLAVEKSVRAAKKKLLNVPLTESDSIPHAVYAKYSSAALTIRPAPKGSGLICGGAVRLVLELAGVENASSKIIRGKTKINVIRATYDALAQLRQEKRFGKKKVESAPAPVASAPVAA